MCIGGNSGNTDRKATLFGFGNAEGGISRLGNLAGRLNAAGESDTGKAARYYSDILSGNPNAVMSAAAPEVNAITKGADQQKKEMANFGDRTGGKNAAAQDLTTNVRGQIGDVISGKREGAASGIARVGDSEQAKGLHALDSYTDSSLNLSKVGTEARQVDQQIHDAAVKQWTDFIKEAFTFAAGGA